MRSQRERERERFSMVPNDSLHTVPSLCAPFLLSLLYPSSSDKQVFHGLQSISFKPPWLIWWHDYLISTRKCRLWLCWAFKDMKCIPSIQNTHGMWLGPFCQPGKPPTAGAPSSLTGAFVLTPATFLLQKPRVNCSVPAQVKPLRMPLPNIGSH